jgi:Fe-S oxidoreductase
MLFEMMRADSPLRDGWRSEDVKESLELCLACKGCLHECPVRVDMATYKAEFFSHYYRRRLRPLKAYALGLIHWEAIAASRMPSVANFLLRREPFASIGKRIVGIAEERRPPAFAPTTFKRRLRDRGPAAPSPPGADNRVVLFADTFNDHFHPEVAMAGLEVLEAAGFEVTVPQRSLCCGRPLYDYGMLKLARRLLLNVLDDLREEIRAGTPVVMLEPSCGAVFRHELVAMLPHDEDAKRLARQTFSLAEFLAQHAAEWEVPQLKREAVVHFHCHQRATSDIDCDRAVLDRLGLDYEVLPAGCCGLAGSFGYEAGEHYEVSVKAGEQALWPAVRQAGAQTLVVTDGFSCRSQVEHGTGRQALHLAQVLQMAVRQQTQTD